MPILTQYCSNINLTQQCVIRGKMKTGFKDPCAIKSQTPKDKPKDGKDSLWDYRCPQYDQRSSCFVNAGTYYGEGHAQPVGTKKQMNETVVPMGRVDTLNVNVRPYE